MTKDTIETRGSTIFTEISFVNGMLIVDMINYGRYEYRQVPQDMWERFKKATSYGSFYNTYIKGVYQFNRLR